VKFIRVGELLFIWMIALIIELLLMYSNIYSMELLFFYFTLIIVTLVVGITILYLKHHSVKNKVPTK